jgi:hypothetical protein
MRIARFVRLEQGQLSPAVFLAFPVLRSHDLSHDVFRDAALPYCAAGCDQLLRASDQEKSKILICKDGNSELTFEAVLPTADISPQLSMLRAY